MHSVFKLIPMFWVLPLAAQDLSVTVVDSSRTSQVPAWSMVRLDRDLLRRHPARSLGKLMETAPGVVRVNADLHIRGSRAGEMEYRFGGVPATDRWSNANSIPFLPEMLEDVYVHTGAYGPELGSFGGGVVDMRLRKGGETFSAEAVFLTDDVISAGTQFLGTSSYGWTTAVLTIATPLPLGSHLFMAGEVSRKADRTPMYLEPFEITLVPDPIFSHYEPSRKPPYALRIDRNRVPSQSSEQHTLQWNLTSSLLETDVAIWGSISFDRARNITWPTAVTNYYRQGRIPWRDQTRTLAAASLERSIGDLLRVRAAASYLGRRAHLTDPHLGESWRSYSYREANAAYGFTGFTGPYDGPSAYVAINGFWFEHENAPNRSYSREASDTWGTQARAELRLSDAWTVVGHAEAEWITERWFSVGFTGGMRNLDPDGDGMAEATFSTPMAERVQTKRMLSISNAGYTFDGEETDDGYEAPRRPSTRSIGVNSVWIDGRLTVAAGLRFQRFERDMLALPPLTPDSVIHPVEPYYDASLSVLREDRLIRTGPEAYGLPRFSVVYATDGGRFFASAGSYAEWLPDQSVQLDILTYSALVAPWVSVPYNLGGSALTDRLRASRTDQAEVGFDHRFDDGLTLRVVAYVKRMTGQPLLGRIPWYEFGWTERTAFVNSGESNATGIEVGMAWTSVPGVTCEGSYAWSQVTGTGSFPRWTQVYVNTEYPPGQLPPPATAHSLLFDRPHRFQATLVIRPTEGAWLHGLDLRCFGVLESGTPYTKTSPPAFMGSSSAWNIGVRSVTMPLASEAFEPWNASRLPWIATIDLSASYTFPVGPVSTTVFLHVTNLLDRKNVINVYPGTGSATSDGWLEQSYAEPFRAQPQYEEFYRIINQQNRWSYMSASGNDMYGAPRQIRFGAKVGI